jgi:hypothetical protein
MSRGLGSMQRVIIAALDTEGGKTGTKKLMFNVGNSLRSRGRDVFIDLSDPAYGSMLCYVSAFPVSFYRALNGLEERGLITWNRGYGGPCGWNGEVVATPTARPASF